MIMEHQRFEWDDAKAASNRRKHDVTFDEAAHAFNDEFRLTRQDRIESGEERWQTLGLVYGTLLLLVAHTIWDDEEGVEVVRIISARRATRTEKREYDDYRAQNFG